MKSISRGQPLKNTPCVFDDAFALVWRYLVGIHWIGIHPALIFFFHDKELFFAGRSYLMRGAVDIPSGDVPRNERVHSGSPCSSDECS